MLLQVDVRYLLWMKTFLFILNFKELFLLKQNLKRSGRRWMRFESKILTEICLTFSTCFFSSFFFFFLIKLGMGLKWPSQFRVLLWFELHIAGWGWEGIKTVKKLNEKIVKERQNLLNIYIVHKWIIIWNMVVLQITFQVSRKLNLDRPHSFKVDLLK